RRTQAHDAERHFGRAAEGELNRGGAQSAFGRRVLRLPLGRDDVAIRDGVRVDRVDQAFFDSSERLLIDAGNGRGHAEEGGAERAGGGAGGSAARRRRRRSERLQNLSERSEEHTSEL